MTTNLPETELPDLREYLFVDQPRVRMLVSQLRGGAPELATSTQGRAHRLKLGLKALGSDRSTDESEQNTLALSDLYVSMLEEDATALGVLVELSENVAKSKFWKRGGLRRSLEPGMLLRVTAPTRLTDPSGLVSIWRRFQEAMDGGDTEFAQILAMIDALYGENLTVAVLPCGPEEPGMAFLGVIGHGTDHVALDRPSLLARLGPDTPQLTSILQVSRVPTERDSAPAAEILLARIGAQIKADPDSVGRTMIDGILVEMMRMTEDHGLQSAPKWPAVAVTPLALYRHIPLAPPLEDDPELDAD